MKRFMVFGKNTGLFFGYLYQIVAALLGLFMFVDSLKIVYENPLGGPFWGFVGLMLLIGAVSMKIHLDKLSKPAIN